MRDKTEVPYLPTFLLKQISTVQGQGFMTRDRRQASIALALLV